MNTITELIRKYPFVAKFLVLMFMWKVMYHIIWHYEVPGAWYYDICIAVITVILTHVSFLLELIGFATEVVAPERIVKIIGTTGVEVGEPCIGIGVTGLFIGLIISYHGKIADKLKYIALGVSVIYFLNLMRIGALAILVQYDPLIWELNHKFVFTIVVYSAIFFMWVNWINFQKIKSDEKDSEGELKLSEV